jgi:hypothetical protein
MKRDSRMQRDFEDSRDTASSGSRGAAFSASHLGLNTDPHRSAEHQGTGKTEPATTPKSAYILDIQPQPNPLPHHMGKNTSTHLLIPQREARRPLIEDSGPSPLHGLLAVVLAVAARVRRSDKVNILRDGAGELDRAAVELVEAPRVVEVDFRAATFAAVVVVAELGPACEGVADEEAEGQDGEGGLDGRHGWGFGWVGWDLG